MSNDRWIPIDEELPPLDTPVWLIEGDAVFIGERSDDSDGWLWAHLRNDPVYYAVDKTWSCDSEQDDIKPTHWRYLIPPEALENLP